MLHSELNWKNLCLPEDILFTPNQVKEAVSDLKVGKSYGYDTLYAEHFKYARHTINVLLSFIFQ